jgi:hypothetical protein
VQTSAPHRRHQALQFVAQVKPVLGITQHPHRVAYIVERFATQPTRIAD